MSFVYTGHYASPIGGITMASGGSALAGLWFDGQKYFASTMEGLEQKEEKLPIFEETSSWLDIYFSGKEPDFTPALSVKGTPFRREVWDILLSIPCGRTLTYGEIAGKIAEKHGIAKMSAQAVGGAVGHNPIAIIIPCHRVVGTDGCLTGYAGGLEKKKWLLEHECTYMAFTCEQ